MKEKNITQDGITGIHMIYMALSVAMIGLSLYLSNHYFEVQFPTTIGQGSLCDFSSFWNCDAATLSPLSNIAGIPIAIFGLTVGCLLLLGSFLPSAGMEGMNKLIVFTNAIGCFVLFVYSLITLGSLCPFCSLYYVCSWAMAFLFFKYGSASTFCPKIAGVFLIISVLIIGGTKLSVADSEKRQAEIAADLKRQYNELPTLGDPKVESVHRLASATEDFSAAPIRLSLFSDFQCPACKRLAEQVPKIAKHFAGKINIQYYFYPLDKACNSKMTQDIHPYACQAAYVATCSGDRFEKIHDDIFHNQEKLSFEWLNKMAKKLGVEDCVKDKATADRVISYIEQGNQLSVASTPTMIINGKRIDGLLPLTQVFTLLEAAAEAN